MYLLTLILPILLVGAVCSEGARREVRSYIGDTDVNSPFLIPEGDAEDFEVELVYPKNGNTMSESFSRLAIKRLWGIPDTRAVVGRIFSYKIPSDAFEGGPFTLKFVKLLPWLRWNKAKGILEGVPSKADVGHHYVTVVAEGATSNAEDIFDINVLPPTEAQLLLEASCNAKTDVSVLSVILDASWPSLSIKEKTKLIARFAKFIMKDSSQVSLAETPADFDPLSDDSAILAGPGSAKIGKSSSSGQVQLEWSVGCGGKINKKNKMTVDLVEKNAWNGKLQSFLGFPIIGWHITLLDPSTRRIRREIDYEFSGDDYYDQYEYVPEYENYDEFFDRLIPSVTSPVSPSATEVPAPPAAPKPHPNYVTPVLKPVPFSTPILIPVKPTRVVVVPSPTATVSSTLPSEHSTDELESSLLIFPTMMVEHTTPLIGPSVKSPHPTEPTRVIRPTFVPNFGESTEYGMKNFAPVIKNRIQKLRWVAGTVYHVQIPEDAFEDQEDGGTRDLSLTLKDKDGKIFGYDSWIQFNPMKQEIYALPLEKEISRFEVQLEAFDVGRKSTVDNLSIKVIQPTDSRNYNHEFTIVLKLEQKFKYELAVALDWQIRAVEKIAQLFNSEISSINVRNISVSSAIHMSWTNISLVDSTSPICPVEQLDELTKILIEEGTTPTDDAKSVFLPEFQLKRARIHYYKSCSHLNHRKQTTISHHETEVLQEFENQGPVFRNQIDELTAEEGNIFRYKVEEDCCYDFKDGGVSGLQMRLLTSELSPTPPSFWLQFDEANKEFYGLPLSADLGTRDYVLECKDSDGEKAHNALVVIVKGASDIGQEPVEFSLKVDIDFNHFLLHVDEQVSLIEKIGKAFGDETPVNIRVSSFAMGSVEVIWTNSSLPSFPCPHNTIERLRVIMTDDSGALRESFKSSFSPLLVLSAHVTPMGDCLSGDTPTHAPIPDVGDEPSISEEQEVKAPEDDYLLTFIIPAVLITLMLLLAAIVACCLWRRRRYAKLSLTDDRLFVSKGVPVIFAEELDDHHRSEGANMPVIMKEEKPPLPPPEYQRHSPSGVSSTPPRGDSIPPDHGPYQPPHPPYASANGSSRNPRPNMPPAYRKPPTYVPP